MSTPSDAHALTGNWDVRYAALCDSAHRRTTKILHSPSAQGRRDARPALGYIYREAKRFTQAYVPDPNAPRGERRPAEAAAEDTLDAVASAIIDAKDDEDFQDAVFKRRPGLWQRLMTEWPMGHYAHMTVEALRMVDAPLNQVVELGAGVGVTTRPLREMLAQRDARLIATDLSYGGDRRVDFDLRLCAQIPPAEAIVATNALHCAFDPLTTLCWIFETLTDGGAIVFAEGAPYPEPGVPWALNVAFGPCRGWFDRGGFRDANFWQGALMTAGFTDIQFTRWPSKRFDLGGVFVARAARSRIS